MQPFPVFDVIRVAERDLAQLHNDRARKRKAEGYPVQKTVEQPSRFTRVLALIIPSRQPKPSTACGD
jgi:hypothetical protein